MNRGYENQTTFALKANEKVAGQTLLAKAHLADAVKQEGLAWNSLEELAAVLEQHREAQQTKFDEATRAANAVADPDEKTKRSLQRSYSKRVRRPKR